MRKTIITLAATGLATLAMGSSAQAAFNPWNFLQVPEGNFPEACHYLGQPGCWGKGPGDLPDCGPIGDKPVNPWTGCPDSGPRTGGPSGPIGDGPVDPFNLASEQDEQDLGDVGDVIATPDDDSVANEQISSDLENAENWSQ